MMIVRALGTSGQWITRAVRAPGHERHVALQGLRCTLAAVIAWLIVARWFSFEQGFLAPYVAVFLVEVTVLRSVQQAAVQVGAVLTGLLVAVGVSELVDSTTVAIGGAVAVGYAVGQWRRFGASGIWVAITALLVIATGMTDSPVLLGERLLETIIGAAVGVAVTMVVFPPVYSTETDTTVLTGEVRDLLRDMADGCRTGNTERQPEWIRRARGIGRLLQRARDEAGWARESARLNPRPAAARIGARARRWDRTLDDLSSVSSAVEELAHGLGPLAHRTVSGMLREAVSDSLDTLADGVDRLEHDEKVDTSDCHRAVDRLEARTSATSHTQIVAALGVVLHTERRIVRALEMDQ